MPSVDSSAEFMLPSVSQTEAISDILTTSDSC
jgi:hypothetical protein